MSDGLRKVLRIAGIALVAVSLGVIGYALFNIISTEISTNNGLADVDQMLQDFESFTGNPEPGQTGTTVSPGAEAQSAEPTDASFTDPAVSEDGEPDAASGSETAGPEKGQPIKQPVYLGKLVFESLGRSVAVREGATKADLAGGAAHHPRSSPPGAVGNCVIYGHRNTVFRGFDKLKDGDRIRLEVPGTTYTYHIASMSVVEPNDPKIFQAYGDKVMTLVTCYPFHYVGSAPQRYIVVCILD